jgi:hypothetical protein
MQQLTDEQRKAQREAWEDTHYKEEIDCPFADGHLAIVYKQGHRFAGIIECAMCEIEDSCEHPESHVEEVEYDVFEPVFGHDTRTTSVYVCDICACQTDGDPEVDRAEAIADMQIMEALGK